MALLELNEAQFRQLVEGEKKTVLVDFWAPWCGYCRRIAPAIAQIAQEYDPRVAVAKVNVDEEPQLAAAQRIEILPTLVLYQNGKAAASVTAPDSKAAIDTFLREALEE